MRPAVTAPSALALLLLLPLASAAALPPLEVGLFAIAPNGTRDVVLEQANATAFELGAVLLLAGGVTNGTSASISLANVELGTPWNWRGESAGLNHILFAVPRAVPNLTLRITNPNDAPIQVYFYYDTACVCENKTAPFPGALVLFNATAEAGDTLRVNLTSPPPMHASLTIYRALPHASLTLAPVGELEANTTGNATFEWQAKQGGAIYYLVEARETAGLVTITTARTPLTAVNTPAVPILITLLVLLAAANPTRKRDSR